MQGLPAAFAFLFFLVSASASAQSPTAPAFARVQRTVSAQNAEAQAAFEDGLTLLYAFNPEAARRSFETAAKADPTFALAPWGIALSYGININSGFVPEQAKLGHQAIAQAQMLESRALPVERALIEAAAKRYQFDRPGDSDRSAHAYADAMRTVAAMFPEDDDVQALAAESALDLTPWSYWKDDGRAEPGTPAIVAQLKAVLARNPAHIGANHFLIHALEESSHPEEALEAARRLATLHFKPAAEHLTHMPAHIFMRVGEYDAAGAANARAVAALKTYLAGEHASGHDGYLAHDCRFGVDAFMMAGEYANAKGLAQECDNRIEADIVDYRFRHWSNLENSDLDLARGVADVAAGKVDDAQRRLHSLQKADGNTSKIAADLLTARLDASRGDRDGEIASLQNAVTIQDGFGYSEPPEWWFPVRESLGGALYRAGKYAQAESVFRADLTKNPSNPRSLFGLARTLEREGRSADAASAQRDFEAAWRQADTELDMKDI